MPKDDRIRTSQKQERGAAKRLGATLHAGSGTGARANDMHTASELIECKTVLQGKRSITLKVDDLNALAQRAAHQDRTPVMHIELPECKIRTWVLVPEVDYREP